MFLTKTDIIESVESGLIHISDFDPKRCGPNSYDVTLGNSLMVYDDHVLDMKSPNKATEIVIPEEGLVLRPGVLYIGSTNESASSHRFIPMFEGRSSVGRLGIATHITAGFGDIGWGYQINDSGHDSEAMFDNGVERYGYKPLHPTWTLEITVVQPVRVYPNVRIGQVYFVKPSGAVSHYTGKYSKQKLPQTSMMFMDFIPKESK